MSEDYPSDFEREIGSVSNERYNQLMAYKNDLEAFVRDLLELEGDVPEWLLKDARNLLKGG